MSRARQQAYRSGEVAELARQLLYAPQAKRQEVVRNAECFHDALDPQSNYPLDFVVYRLTGRRVPPQENVMLVGEALGPDLRLLVDALSRSVPMADDPHDPAETTKELAQRLGVSPKTIARWRNAALRWRWGVRAGKPAVLITRSAFAAFEQHSPERVPAAAGFSRLSEEDKRRLIRRARRLAQATAVPPQRVLNHLAKRSGRSAETLRQLIHQHDIRPGADAVFASRNVALNDKEKRVIDRAYRRGVTVSALCERFGKTRSTLYRVINDARVARITAIRLTSIDLPTFEREDADEVFMRPPVREQPGRRLGPEAVAALPAALMPVYDRPVESDGYVRSLIVRYHFLKHRAIALRGQILAGPARARDLDRFDAYLGQIDRARGEAIGAVLPAVLSVVLRQMPGGAGRSPQGLRGLLFTAHGVLFEELDRFDAGLSHTFESVLTNRLLRVLAPRNLAPGNLAPRNSDPREPGPNGIGASDITEQVLVNQLRAQGFRALAVAEG